MKPFDPSGTGSYHTGLFGIPSDAETARVVIIPVPWEVTTSYGEGTARGPQAVLEASPQIDLFDLELGRAYEKGYHLLQIPGEILAANDLLKKRALTVREQLENNGELSAEGRKIQSEINDECARMCKWVHEEAKAILKRGQIPAVLGGDHSVPEGNIQAVSESVNGDFGVLHIDAHADLRDAYQGFTRSHASIMFNVMNAPWRPKKLVQVGVRDFSEEEYELTRQPGIRTFFDAELKSAAFEGTSWSELCRRIVGELPQRVYISFDIDGLSPEFCPNTGTPVPGGLSFDQAAYLLKCVAQGGRTILGFDLNEVSFNEQSEWDGNVGARMLYKMCGWTALSGR